MPEGTVRWFNETKGYGFISANEGKDVFVHRSGIVSNEYRPSLKEGDKVEFQVEDSPKGEKAVGVRKI